MNLINVSGDKQNPPHNSYLKQCPNAEFTGFPLHLIVLSVGSQLDLAVGTPGVSGAVQSSEMDPSLGWCIGLRKLSCMQGFLLPQESAIVTEELGPQDSTAGLGRIAGKIQMGKQGRDWGSLHRPSTESSDVILGVTCF